MYCELKVTCLLWAQGQKQTHGVGVRGGLVMFHQMGSVRECLESWEELSVADSGTWNTPLAVPSNGRCLGLKRNGIGHIWRTVGWVIATLKVKVLVTHFVTPWTIAHQAPLSLGFPRQEYWTGLPFLSSGDLPDPRISLESPAFQADSLLSEPMVF